MKIGYTGFLQGIKKGSITIGERTIATDKAMWDTGATITAISHSAVKQFDAVPDEVGTCGFQE